MLKISHFKFVNNHVIYIELANISNKYFTNLLVHRYFFLYINDIIEINTVPDSNSMPKFCIFPLV